MSEQTGYAYLWKIQGNRLVLRWPDSKKFAKIPLDGSFLYLGLAREDEVLIHSVEVTNEEDGAIFLVHQKDIHDFLNKAECALGKGDQDTLVNVLEEARNDFVGALEAVPIEVFVTPEFE